MNLSDDELENLWFKMADGQATAAEQQQLKAFLSTPEHRARWKLLLDLDAALAKGISTSTPKSSAPTVSHFAPKSTLPPRMILRWVGWGSMAALLMITLIMGLQLGWIKGPSKNKIIGQVISVVGETSVDRGLIHVGLMPDMAIKEDDDLLTGLHAAIWISLKDGSLVRLGENARLHVGSQQFESTKLLQLARGTLYCQVQTQPKALNIETPHQKIKITGTRFALVVNDHKQDQLSESLGEQLALFEGTVHISNPKGQEQFELREGETLVFQDSIYTKRNRDEFVAEATFDHEDAELERWVFTREMVSFFVEIPYVFNGEKTTRNPQLLRKMQALVRGDKVTCVLEKSDVYILRQIEKWGIQLEK